MKKPTTWFVDSMSDLFHPSVPDQFIEGVISVMAIAEQHTFQILTKRPQRMAALLQRTSWDCNGDVHIGAFTAAEVGEDGNEFYDVAGHLPNVWWGTSVENDTYAFRAKHLRAAPGRVKFLSLEPLLGPVPSLDLAGIDWVIVGGESGPEARPMNPYWAHDIRKQCQYDKVPFFFKQWGAWAPIAPVYEIGVDGRDGFDVDEAADRCHVVAVCPSGHIAQTSSPVTTGHTDHQPCSGAWWMAKVGKKAAGRLLDGRTWDETPA